MFWPQRPLRIIRTHLKDFCKANPEVESICRLQVAPRETFAAIIAKKFSSGGSGSSTVVNTDGGSEAGFGSDGPPHRHTSLATWFRDLSNKKSEDGTEDIVHP